MLVYEYAKCEQCGRTFRGILQYLKRTCKRCDITMVLCDACVQNRCPRCGGKMETEQEKQAKKGKYIMY